MFTSVPTVANLDYAVQTGLSEHVPMSNNKAERAERGVVLGRKNHQGSRSRRGAEVAAILYTLMESAKLTGVSKIEYLTAVVYETLTTPGAVLLPSDFKARQVVKDLKPA